MKLVINSPGVYLSKRGECFLLQKRGGEKQEFSRRKVEQILITTAAAISTDAIELAIENNIDIVFLKYNGKPLGRIWHSRLGSISTIRRKQLLLQDHPYGLQLVKEWILKKLENQVALLNKLAMNRRDERRQIIKDAVNVISKQTENIRNIDENKVIEDVRGSLLGYEGTAGRTYFTTLGKLIPSAYAFVSRSRNPALDPFNCILNYAYGILYSSVEKSCILAGLDPYIGIMHTDNYNKTALVYDLIEMYRTNMDELVFKLFTTRKVSDSCFDIVEGGYYLNQEGEKLLIGEYNKGLERKVRHKGRNIQMQNIIQFDCHELANKILQKRLSC